MTTLLIAGAAALVSIGSAAERILRAPPPAPREATLPPAPPMHAGSMLDGDLAAIRGRLTSAEAEIAELRRGMADMKRADDQAATDAARKALAGELRRLVGEMRGGKKKEKDDDGHRESQT